MAPADQNASQELPNSLRRSSYNTESRSTFNFSWVGGIAQRIRNLLNQKTTEEAQTIEHQSEAALRDRIRSSFIDTTANADESGSEEESIINKDRNDDYKLDGASGKEEEESEHDESETDESIEGDAALIEQPYADEEHWTGHRDDNWLESDMEDEGDDEEAKELDPSLDEDLNEDDDIDEIDYELLDEGDKDVDMNDDEEVVDVNDEQGEAVDDMDDEKEPEAEPANSAEHTYTHVLDVADGENMDENYSEDDGDSVPPADISEHDAEEPNPEMSDMNVWDEHGFDSYEVPDTHIEEPSPPSYDADELKSDMNEASFEPESANTSKLGSENPPLGRYVGFLFGPGDEKEDEGMSDEERKKENTEEAPEEHSKIKSNPKNTDAASVEEEEVKPSEVDPVGAGPATVPLNTNNNFTINKQLPAFGEWNLFNVGFTVAPALEEVGYAASPNKNDITTSDKDYYEKKIIDGDNAEDEGDFEAEFFRLAETAHRLISGSSLFGGSSAIGTRNRPRIPEDPFPLSTQDDPELETKRVAGTAKALFSVSPLFGGASRKRSRLEVIGDDPSAEKPEDEDSAKVQKTSEETQPIVRGDLEGYAKDIKTDTNDHDENAEATAAASDTIETTGSNVKTDSKGRKIPERRRPVTRHMLRAIEKEKLEKKSSETETPSEESLSQKTPPLRKRRYARRRQN